MVQLLGQRSVTRVADKSGRTDPRSSGPTWRNPSFLSWVRLGRRAADLQDGNYAGAAFNAAMAVGMELIDSDGRRWRVLSVRRTGLAGSVLSLLWIFGPPQSRIEHELEPLPAVSLAEVQERSRQAMETSRIDYYGEEGHAEYRSMLRKIGTTRSIAKLQPDTFEPF